MYIHELKDCPNFLWSEEIIANELILLRHQQGRLLGGMESIGFQLREETVLQTLTQEIVKSSEIEGEILDQASVRSSVARRFGIETAAISPIDKNVEGIVEMMFDATQEFNEPLTKERLLNWHSTLLPVGYRSSIKIKIGVFRPGPVEIVSGRLGDETVHFEGPSAERVEHEMKLLLI